MRKDTLKEKTGILIFNYPRKDAIEVLFLKRQEIIEEIDKAKLARKILIKHLKVDGLTLSEIKELPEFIEDTKMFNKLKKKIEYIDCFMENIHKFDKYFVVDR